ncbi:type IV secretion protein Dot [Legionella norrlandica]|uniref:Type IV secretion protein Dot n=1 Tax=Legionella norrlandica TaxID=1498499 RepID=A0A0A2SSG2_9GAMM|nr:type IV secretion protein Dot [Legionella norrlandica]KGP62349.1 type IV secretion protein Dot [Legionella norrlandica]
MTFVLREFEDLKKHFNDTVDIILQREDKKKIEELPSPRKEEIQFLQSVLTKLEDRLSQHQPQPKSLKPYATVFYGAMLLICRDIENKLGYMERKENSLLYTRLMDGMGITDSNLPLPNQYIIFYKELNKLLSFIYVDNDSRKGLKQEHFLQKLSLKELSDFVKLSFLQEERAEKNALAKLTADGKSKIDANTFQVVKTIDASILEPFKSWPEMKEALHKLILEEFSDKNVANFSKLEKKNQDRAAQLQFLHTLAEQLDNIPEQNLASLEKIAILAGAMYIVRGQIAIEYSKAPLSNNELSGSIIHTGLTKILHANAESYEDIEVFITAANRFIRHMTIERPESSNRSITKEAIREKHLFSEITGFNLSSVLPLIQEMIKTCRSEALDACVIKRHEELEALKPKSQKSSITGTISGYVGNWWGSKKPTSATSEHEEDEEAQKSSVPSV